MPEEIERKFLVVGDGWRENAEAETTSGRVSSRPSPNAPCAYGSLGRMGRSPSRARPSARRRQEFEYEIPGADAQRMLDTLCERPLIEKVRYTLCVGRHTWEVDVFEGENAGLVIAEVELESEEEAFDKPDWAGEEVTDEPRYFNSNLVAKPFRTWSL